MTRALALALCLLVAGGCSKYKPPRLMVRDAAITSVTDEGVVIDFVIDAENRNQVELPLRSVTYRVTLNGREVFRGVRSPEATLRRLGTQSIRLPAVVNTEDEAVSLAPPIEYRIEGRLTYITPGSVAEILFDAGVRRPKVRFRSSGTLELSEEFDAGPVGLGDGDVDAP